MTLILSNEEIDDLLEMDELIPILEDAYRELAEGRGGNRRRSDIVTPTSLRDDGHHALKSMDGVIPKLGVGAIRINSDIVTYPLHDDKPRRVKVPAAPGERYVGLVLLFSTHTGEPLAILPDGVMQRARVGATNGIAAKYMARDDARVLAVLGSGWQAGTQVTAHAAVRALDEIRVYSPNRENREAFAVEMSGVTGTEVRACDSGLDACRGADIVACATNSAAAVFSGDWLEPGMHIGVIRPGGIEIDKAAWDGVDQFALMDHIDQAEFIYTDGVPAGENRSVQRDAAYNAWHAALPTLPQIITGRREGRADDEQMTCFLNTLGMGYQFAAAGYLVHKKAVAAGIGNELPTDWFTETVHP